MKKLYTVLALAGLFATICAEEDAPGEGKLIGGNGTDKVAAINLRIDALEKKIEALEAEYTKLAEAADKPVAEKPVPPQPEPIALEPVASQQENDGGIATRPAEIAGPPSAQPDAAQKIDDLETVKVIERSSVEEVPSTGIAL